MDAALDDSDLRPKVDDIIKKARRRKEEQTEWGEVKEEGGTAVYALSVNLIHVSSLAFSCMREMRKGTS